MAKERKFQDGLMFLKLENQKIPEFREVKNKDWVYYGEDNMYPDYLISLYERSATHNAIINGKVSYILGQGWTGQTKGLTPLAEAKINDYINDVNPDESLDELTEKVALDFENNNGFYLEVVKDKSGKKLYLYHIPFSKIRTNEDESTFFYSKDWSARAQTEEKTGFKEFKAFDASSPSDSSIFYFKILSPRKGKDPNVYPLPNFIGGTNAIETEIEANNYNLSEIKSGFSAGSMLNFYNGIPTDDEKKKIKKQIIDQLSGTDNAGKFVLNFSDGKERGSEVIALNGNDLPERYTNVRKDSMRTIFTSHRVSSPELFGVQQENVTFGGRAQIAEQYELFQNTYISKRQKILERVFNDFASLNGVSGRMILMPTAAINTDVFTEATVIASMPPKAIKDLIADRMGIDISKYDVGIKDSSQDIIGAINSMSPLVATKILESMTTDEIRSLAQLPKGVVQTTTTTTESKFSEDVDPILIALEKVGRSKELFHIDESVEFNFVDDEQADEDEKALLIPKIPKAVKKEVEADKVEILYSYELRADAPALKGESRDFCKRLIALDFLYTRGEITQLSNEFGTSVWKYKGGWYTKSNGAHVPQCRHIWKANIVRRK